MDWANISVNEIWNKLKNADMEQKKKAIEILKFDGRSGAQKIVKRLEREIEGYNNEIKRINEMKIYEMKYISKGAKFIAGIDEVGRGPLAGPVYAGAVIFPIDCIIEGINDSKKLSAKKRSELYEKVKENAIDYAIGYSDVKIIDEMNILNATYEAMKMAIGKLKVKPDVLLVDAVRIPGINIFQVPIIKGDSLSFSIAGASIIAKVERDNIMDEYDKKYPMYRFSSNKGYGTKEHIEALKAYGPCPLHRKTFISGII